MTRASSVVDALITKPRFSFSFSFGGRFSPMKAHIATDSHKAKRDSAKSASGRSSIIIPLAYEDLGHVTVEWDSLAPGGIRTCRFHLFEMAAQARDQRSVALAGGAEFDAAGVGAGVADSDRQEIQVFCLAQALKPFDRGDAGGKQVFAQSQILKRGRVEAIEVDVEQR